MIDELPTPGDTNRLVDDGEQDPAQARIFELLNDCCNRVITVLDAFVDAKCRQAGAPCLDPQETMATMNGVVSALGIFASRLQFTRNEGKQDDPRTPEMELADAFRQQFLDVFYQQQAFAAQQRGEKLS